MVSIATSRFYAAEDGLRLHLRDYSPARDEGRPPLVCLSGLTRNADDSAELARALSASSEGPRRVLAFDYRGRGRSDHDPDWHHYDLATERADFLAGLDLLGIEAAHFLGTSRGGLHIMALARSKPAMIQSAILNDIGPVLEPAGLQRIKSYVGVSVSPASYEEAISLLKQGAGQQFDDLSAAEWQVFAETTFGTDPDNLHLRYDPQLARTLDGLDLAKPLPEDWEGYDALRGKPLLSIRGAGSDLLSATVQDNMTKRWQGCESYIVPGQGHAPLLIDSATISRIAAFLFRAEISDPH